MRASIVISLPIPFPNNTIQYDPYHFRLGFKLRVCISTLGFPIMSLSPRSEAQLKQRSQEAIRTAKDPVEKLRLRCLARGANGIRGLGRTFRLMDDDRSRALNFAEFHTGLNDYGLILPKQEMTQLFSRLDPDGSGSIDFNEFLEVLRPPMSEKRQALVAQAFVKLDRSGEGLITIQDLKGVYNVKHHKKYRNGEWTEDQCLREFLDNFDMKNSKDGKVTQDEFLNYYSAVSASIDQDPYFDLMMRNAYRLTD